MKKTLKIAGTLFLVAFLFFSAAVKKTPQLKQEPGKIFNSGFAIQHFSSLPFTVGEPEPTGVLEVTEELYNVLADGKYVESEQVEPHRYIAKNIIIGPPNDPCAQDWIDFNNYIASHLAAFQAWANAHCRPYMGCWQGRCVAIAFFINPTKHCWEPAYEQYLKVFE